MQKRQLWRTRIRREWGHPGKLGRDASGMLNWYDKEGEVIRQFGVEKTPRTDFPSPMSSARSTPRSERPEMGADDAASQSSCNLSISRNASTDPGSPSSRMQAPKAAEAPWAAMAQPPPRASYRLRGSVGGGTELDRRLERSSVVSSVGERSSVVSSEADLSESSSSITRGNAFEIGKGDNFMSFAHPSAQVAPMVAPMQIAPMPLASTMEEEEEEEFEEELELPKKGHPSRLMRAKKANATKYKCGRPMKGGGAGGAASGPGLATCNEMDM